MAEPQIAQRTQVFTAQAATGQSKVLRLGSNTNLGVQIWADGATPTTATVDLLVQAASGAPWSVLQTYNVAAGITLAVAGTAQALGTPGGVADRQPASPWYAACLNMTAYDGTGGCTGINAVFSVS